MRGSVIGVTIVLGLMIVVAGFMGGQFAERQAQRRSSVQLADVNARKHIHILNIASVPFGESWDLMRRATRKKRSAWARELEHLPAGTRRNASIESFYKIWVGLDPFEAVRGVETIQDKRLQTLSFRAVADAAADSALSIIAQLELQLGYRASEFGASSVLGRWAAVDPEAVGHFLQGNPNRGSARFFDVAYSWAQSDPQKAAAWVMSLKLPPLHDAEYPRMHDRRRLDATRGLFLGWLDKDWRGAVAFAAAHANDPDVKDALGEFTRVLFIISREDAREFIQSLPDETSQCAALVELLEHMRGVIMMSEGGDEEEPKEPEIDCKDIVPWLVTLPANLWIDNVGDIFQCWDANDGSRAESWLRSLSSAARSKAIVDYCGSAPFEKAGRVLELSALIYDLKTRNQLLQKFVDRISDDPSKARAKIATLSLTPDQKQMLMSRLRK